MLTAIWALFIIYTGFYYTGMFSNKRTNNIEQKRTQHPSTY